MNCEICFEPFDHSAHKPYSLSSCPHTYCTICLDRLTSNKCPQCSKQIIGKNVNIQLLKLIPKSEYDKIKEDTLRTLIEINESKQDLKYERQDKLKIHETKIISIKQVIKEETSKMVNLLKQNEIELIDECDEMLIEIRANLDSNKYEDNSSILIPYSKEKIEKNESNKDELQKMKKQILEIKQQIQELAIQIKNYENKYEFIPNKMQNSVGEFITPHNCLIKGHFFLKKNQFEKALEVFNKSIELDSDYQAYEVLYYKSLVLIKLNKNEDAIECLNKIIELDPTDSLAYDQKGQALWNLKKYKDAIIFFNKANELNPKISKRYSCNVCGKTGLDPRYKCSICSDYDLCEICEEKGIHDNDHILYKFTAELDEDFVRI